MQVSEVTAKTLITELTNFKKMVAKMKGNLLAEERPHSALAEECAQKDKALAAIIARIQGDWYNPALVAFGDIGDTKEDILKIAQGAIGDTDYRYKFNAEVIANYFAGYRKYIETHNLDDDSNDIEVSDLVSFIDDQIPDEDREQYGLFRSDR